MSIPALISVVVPAKNEERDLGACLAGVSRRDCEVVVVDDGSTDRSAAVAEEAGARVILQPGLGPAAARNRGVKEARGDVILFLDADCRVGPTWVEQLSTPIREGRADVTVGPYLSDQENWVARLVQLELEQRYSRMKKRGYVDYVNSGNSGFTRALLLDHPFDETYRKAGIEDVELSFRLAQAGARMMFLPEAGVIHMHPERLWAVLKRKFYYGSRGPVLYRRYPKKVVGDASTPQKRRAQIALLGLAGAVLPFSPGVGLLLLAASVAFSLPFVIGALRRSWLLGVLAPVFVLSCNLAFLLGGVYGLATAGRR